MNKLVIMTDNGVVVQARVISEEEIGRVIAQFPYRRNDDIGNSYARFLRSKDYRLERGENVEVVVLPEGDDEFDILYKIYDPIEKTYRLQPGMSEDARKHKVGILLSRYPVGRYNDIEYMTIPYDMVSSYLTEPQYLSIAEKFRLHQFLSDDDIRLVESVINGLDEASTTRVIYSVAAHYSRVVLDPDVGQKPEPRTLEYKVANMDKALYWWRRLEGTEKEVEAASAIASIYVQVRDPKSACAVYEAILCKPLSDEYKGEIEEKLMYIGTSWSIYDDALDTFKRGDYAEAKVGFMKFCSEATGMAKDSLLSYAQDYVAKCITEMAKLESDPEKQISMIKEANEWAKGNQI